MEVGGGAFKILIDTPTGNIPLGTPGYRWEDNIRTELKEIGINTRSWVDSAQDRDCKRPCECSIEPPCSIIHGMSE